MTTQPTISSSARNTVTTTTALVGDHPALEVVSYLPQDAGPRCALSLLLVHGACHSATCWHAWGPALAELGIPTHALSLRGHGKSTMPGKAQDARRATIRDFVADIRTVYDALRIDPARSVLAGHSMGGIIVQWFAQKFAVAGLAILASVTTSRALPCFMQVLRDAHVRLGTNARALFDTERNVRRYLLGEDAKPATVQFVLGQLRPESEVALYSVLGAYLLRAFPPQRLRTEHVLVLGAEKDACFKASVVEASARDFARRYDTTCAIIPDCPHDLMLAHESARQMGVSSLAKFCEHCAPVKSADA
jgi:pimeloyl-ACP methyl ester carboxylesterase